MRKRKREFNVRRKNRRKVFRTIVQTILLLTAVYMVVMSIVQTNVYEEPDRTAWTNRDGFIALSYFGVARTGTAKLVEARLMEDHLQALYEQGYETISQQDILRFYNEGKPLPEKALFLTFEDGRNDSALYAQSILEKLNYKATFLSYANKMGNSERKFLQPKDMLKMVQSGYWELGSNGYRLTYINVFDHEGQFIGVRDDLELKKMDIANIAYYNHYLMDFIRDEHMIPVENREEMFARIEEDYAMMERVYKETLGFVPDLYMIMHANTIYNGMHRLVEEANEVNIKRIFNIHFNREGSSYNTSEENIYNLTRLQIEPYWYTNHVLMKIKEHTGASIKFVRGDEERAKAWEGKSGGAAQFIDDRIVITSPPGEAGSLYLSNSEPYRNVKLTTDVSGNVVGKQSVYVRYDRDQQTFVRVTIHDNRLVIEQKIAGNKVEPLFDEELSAITWRSEDLAFDKASIYSQEQTASGANRAFEDGGYPINIQNTRNLEIVVRDQSLTVAVDKNVMFDGNIDASLTQGGIALQAEYSEQNKKDNVYDAVFDDLEVVIQDEQGEHVAYENKIAGVEEVVKLLSRKFHSLIDWIVDTF